MVLPDLIRFMGLTVSRFVAGVKRRNVFPLLWTVGQFGQFPYVRPLRARIHACRGIRITVRTIRAYRPYSV